MTRTGLLLGAIAVGLVGCGDGEGEGGGDPPEPTPTEVAEPGDIETWMGDGLQGHDGDGHDRLESSLNTPMEAMPMPDGSMYVVDWNNHAVRVVDSDGVADTFAGSGPNEVPGDWPCERPELPDFCEVPLDQVAPASEVRMNHPMDVALLDDGNVLIAAWHNHKVEQCTADTQEVTVISGLASPGFTGDDGPASAAKLNFPSSIVVDSSGTILLADQRNNRVRRIDLAAGGLITTVVGMTSPSAAMGTNPSWFSGDGGPALVAGLGLAPYDLAGGVDNPPPGGALVLDGDGRLYIADTYNHCIRSVAPGADGLITGETDEVIDVVAGRCGEEGYSGDGEAATEALFNKPFDLEIGPDGRLYVADTFNHAVRAIDLDSGIVEGVVGTGEAGFSGDLFPAIDAQLRTPYGLAFDAEDALIVVDSGNNRIRRVVP